MSNYSVVDKRRVTVTGARRAPIMPARPSINHKEMPGPVERTWRHINTHIERNIRDGQLRPETLWTHLWGLALSTRQTHQAVAVLLAEKQRPNTLPLQASILVRSMLEALGNVLALTSAKCAFRWFLADGYRRQFEQLEELRKDFAGSPKWDKWFGDMDRVLEIEASWASLGRRHQDENRARPRLTRRLQPTHRQKQRWAAEAESLCHNRANVIKLR